MGFLFPMKRYSHLKTIILFIIVISYDLLRALFHINVLALDLTILHFLGLSPWSSTISLITIGSSKKRIFMLIICFVLTVLLSFSYVSNLFVGSFQRKASDYFIPESEYVSVYHSETYQRYLDTKNTYESMTGIFEGFIVDGDELSIQISGEHFSFQIDGDSCMFIRKTVYDPEEKIAVNWVINGLLDENLRASEQHKYLEYIANVISLRASVEVFFDEQNEMKFMCIYANLYEMEMRRF